MFAKLQKRFVSSSILITILISGLWNAATVKAGAAAIPEVSISTPDYPVGVKLGENTLIPFSLTESNNVSGDITSRTDRFYTQYDVPLSDSMGPYTVNVQVDAGQTHAWDESIQLPENVVNKARAMDEYALVLKSTFYGTSGAGTAFSSESSLLLLLPPDGFGKVNPGDGDFVETTNPSLQWNASVGAIDYEYCLDTDGNNICDSGWKGSYDTSVALQNLVPGTTYYWQVRANNTAGTTEADNGDWWRFTVSCGTMTVTTTNFSGPGSLSEAVSNACPGRVIKFDPTLAGKTITLASNLMIFNPMKIDGTGLSPQVTINGANLFHLEVVYAANVTITDVTFANGYSDSDGGAIVSFGNLSVFNSTLRNNHSDGSGGAIAIRANGRLVLKNASLYQNQAAGRGGAVTMLGFGPNTITDSTFVQNQGGDGGALYSRGILTIRNSTIGQNIALGSGGGIYSESQLTLENSAIYQNRSGNSGGALVIAGNSMSTITNSTITENQAHEGGSIFMVGNAWLDVLQSTIAGNNASQATELMLWGTGSFSLSNTILLCAPADTGCILQNGFVTVSGPIHTGTFSEFGLAPIADNGGPTPTIALYSDSPFIDAGDDSVCANTRVNSMDQRGITRPQGAHCDVGAYESNPVIRYVKWNATGANNGTSWENAYTSLQSALTAASNDTEIWVAAGVYKPTTGSNRTISFVLKSGVAVYGGLAGTETNRAERDPVSNITVLSGDIAISDSQKPIITDLKTVTGNSINSYHVVTGATGATLDGFTITAGYANGPFPFNVGAGLYNNGASPRLANITFSGNLAANSGGGMRNDSSHPALTNVVFNGNSAVFGGGMVNIASSPTLTNVTFSGNWTPTDGNGGGMENNSGSSPILTSVIFINNSADYGGGMMNRNGSAPTLTDVMFIDNSAGIQGGGLENSFQSSPKLTNVTFNNNSATFGGGMYNFFGSSPLLANVTFNGNSATEGGGMDNANASSPVLTDVTFSQNTAVRSGGGMLNIQTSRPTLMNVAFNHNTAFAGGGMANVSSDAELTNVTFNQNSAERGGGMMNAGSKPILTNVTISGNQATVEGGGISNEEYGSPFIRNLILWGNNAPAGMQIYNDPTSNPVINYSVVQGGYPGVSNIDADPLLGPLQDNGGFTQTMPLAPGSSAIDTGDDVNCPAFDPRGVTRPQGAHCDIGAYEADGSYVPTPIPTATFTPTNTPTATPPYSYQPLYLSFANGQSIGGISSADEDILRFDGASWSLLFDGSDVGVGSPDLFAFSILDSDSILMAFNTSVTVNGISAAPQDVLRFDATSLGSTTAGTFSLYFDGSDVGLSTTDEKIDAMSLLADGRLLISTTGASSVPGVSAGRDEDVLVFAPTSLGSNTSGTWSMYFDGSDVGLSETSGEDIDALDVVGGSIYLSTLDTFSVTGLSGADEDVFICMPTSTGDVTACNYSPSLYFDGSTWNLSANDVDAINIIPSGSLPTPTPTNTPGSTSTPTATATPSRTPTATATGGPTSTPTATRTPTATFTATMTPTSTFTSTPTSTGTPPSGVITYSVQPDGATGVDTYMFSSSPTTNFGSDIVMAIGENNNATNRVARGLIKFDLSSIPSNATIVSATLSLWTGIDVSDNTRTLRVYRLKVPFDETQATWNVASTGVSWQSPGAAGTDDRESVDIGSVQILANELSGTRKQISLSSAKIEEIVRGVVANQGFLLMVDTELNDRFNYKSSDSTTIANRPMLVIQYTVP